MLPALGTDFQVGSHRTWVHTRAWAPRVPMQTGAYTDRGIPPGGVKVKKSWSQGLNAR